MNRGQARNLLKWYQRSKRDLPWRNTRDPYRIWVSEIMLQQTRVAAVIPYYDRFLEKFPSLKALAEATDIELLSAWAGLGYYSRVRNMQRAARLMDGVFPSSHAEIRELPGIGDYTAAAIASIAFGQRHAAIDGNALRVLARVTGDSGDVASQKTRRRLAAAAEAVMPAAGPGAFNQAVMELGATICLPRGKPLCEACPLAQGCVANLEGRQQELPIKAAKSKSIRVTRTLLYALREGRTLLRQYPADAPKLAGFWELPDAGRIPLRETQPLGTVRHSITNMNYLVHVVAAKLPGPTPEGCEWRDLTATSPLSTVTRKALALTGLLPG